MPNDHFSVTVNSTEPVYNPVRMLGRDEQHRGKTNQPKRKEYGNGCTQADVERHVFLFCKHLAQGSVIQGERGRVVACIFQRPVSMSWCMFSVSHRMCKDSNQPGHPADAGVCQRRLQELVSGAGRWVRVVMSVAKGAGWDKVLWKEFVQRRWNPEARYMNLEVRRDSVTPIVLLLTRAAVSGWRTTSSSRNTASSRLDPQELHQRRLKSYGSSSAS